MRWMLACAVLAVLVLVLWRATGVARAPRRALDVAVAPAGPRRREPAKKPTRSRRRGSRPRAAAHEEQRLVRVVGTDGAPIPGAWIDSHADGLHRPRTSRVLTDRLGWAVLRPAPFFDSLVFGADGFGRAVASAAALRDGAEIVLEPGYRIAGIVTDAAGRPVVGATVELSESPAPARTIVAGRSGDFEFADVGANVGGLVVAADGFLKERLPAAPGDTAVRVVLHRPGSLRGVVAFPDGSPASGARVGRDTADAFGRFAIGGLRPGPIHLEAVLLPERRWSARVRTRLEPDGPPVRVRVVLEEGSTSCRLVRVLDGSGAPLRGVQVHGGIDVVVTDADGRVRCAFRRPPGSEVTVRVPGTTAREQVCTESFPGDEETVLRPRPPRHVTVIARGPGGEALPADVTAEFEGHPFVSREHDRATFVVQDGLYVFLRVRAPGYGADREWIRRVADDDRLEVRLPGTGAIRGRVAGAGGGAVRVNAAPGPRCVAAPDGTYFLADVPAGRVRVVAWESETRAGGVETEVRAGEVVDLGTLVLRGPRYATGIVTDARGRGLGGVRVTIDASPVYDTWSHADGSFRLRIPHWFAGRVQLYKTGRGTVHAAPAVGMAVVMRTAGRVEVELLRGGEPVTAEIEARDPGTGFAWKPCASRIERGRYLLQELPPGRLVLAAGGGETEVVVVPSETVAAEITVVD